MVQRHPSTPPQRVQAVSQLLAAPRPYGLVTRLSQELGVSRPTLYAWKAHAQQALEQAFLDTTVSTLASPQLARQILTLLVEGHSSYAGIQANLRVLTGQRVSIGTIATIVQEAQQRALQWMASQAPSSARALALDEIYANNRRGAYLSVVDCHSWAVWAAEGPLGVDRESWTLLLWSLQERGLHWYATVTHGGDALQAALQQVDPHGQHRRDVWHLLHQWAAVLGRLQRRRDQLVAQTATVERQAARIAAGHKPRGGRPKTDLAAHAVDVAAARRSAADLGYLGQELQRLLEVLVLSAGSLLSAAARQTELETLLELLAEVQAQAASHQRDLQRLAQHVANALPQALAFVAALERVEQELRSLLGERALALLAWAWQRRHLLEMRLTDLVAAIPEGWRAAARVLLLAWERAVRASSAVENWHSILRPHLAVHRRLSPGMLALLAVWHNHGVFSRGVHAGASPLQLSGMSDAPTDWLLALGYPPATDAVPVGSYQTPTYCALAA